MKVTFGSRLRYLRILKNLTQIECAELLNFSKTNFSCWENDKNEPTLSTLIKLADFFGVSIDYLACLEE